MVITPHTWAPLAGLLTLFCLPLPARADEVYRIGAEDDWYPYTAYRDGQIQGMSVDIVRAAFGASSTRIELLPYPYSRCMELTRVGKLAACFNTSPDARIAAEFRLPQQALFRDDILLWARNGQAAAIDDLNQLAGRRVAVTIGYEYGTPFDSLQAVLRVPVRHDLNGFLMLQHERVDYVAAYRGTVQALLQQHPELAGQFSAVATLHRPQLYLSFSRYHPQADTLLQRFDQGMQQIRDNGRYRQILQQWQHPADPD